MKILVVEDDILLLKTIEFKLKKEGYSITIAKNGLDAIENLKENTYDFIITDIMMPYLNGLEIVNFVRNEQVNQTPIIVLSSAKHESMIMDAFNLGANDFISKPFVPDELLLRIKKISNQIIA